MMTAYDGCQVNQAQIDIYKGVLSPSKDNLSIIK